MTIGKKNRSGPPRIIVCLCQKFINNEVTLHKMREMIVDSHRRGIIVIMRKGDGTKKHGGSGKEGPPIYVVSGGSGASGERIVETLLSQFPGSNVPVIGVAHVRKMKEIEEVVKRARAEGGTIVHTLVDDKLREALISLGEKNRVATIDLMGALLDRLSEVLGRKPLGQPGLYRQLHRDYFRRVDAIDFAVAHDDGQRPEDLGLADIVLIGVSRCGKTPLSMYLAVQGWKVANVPLIMDVPPPQELFKIDRRRVVGLSIEYEQLMVHRKKRLGRIGTAGHSAYADPAKVFEEMEAARRIYAKGGFSVISVTNKPIEMTADEIAGLIIHTFGDTDAKK
jgi:[pyruvate, water dikinase]-phosphate phosphotransferase / [pyruvate, water dikinase] kinase